MVKDLMMDDVLDDIASRKKYTYTFKWGTVAGWIALLLLGLFFEIRLWPGASTLIILSTAGLSAYSISGMIALRGANTLNTVLTVGAVVWISVLLYGVSFNEGYPYNLFGFFLFASILALFIAIYEAIKYFKKRSFEKGLF